ncbi:MAG: histone deacetylase family protein [Alphaproteobacteria bacterium]|nr:histone deacetylase family protein [Alphaproteobacteria bacterium]
MTTALFSSPACLAHATPPGHPESPDRLRAVLRALETEPFQYLMRVEAEPALPEALARAHTRELVEAILGPWSVRARQEVYFPIDADTVMSAGTADAARIAAGAVMGAVDLVAAGTARNAFCAVRPPGHHAERARAMGFCFFNNVAVGALYARAVHGFQRVAVLDFDVHHGNGTQDIAAEDPDFFYASTHQWPLYPGSGRADEQGCAGNIVNVPLSPGSDGVALRQAFSEKIFPALRAFAPDFVFLSSGFDGHRADPIAELCFSEMDFAWVTRETCVLADALCAGRVVSALEGGYDLAALAHSAAAHVEALMGRP